MFFMKIWGIHSGIRENDEQIQSLGQEFSGHFEFKSATLKPLWRHVTSFLGYTHDSFFEHGADQLVAPWPDIIINGHPSTAAIAMMVKQRSHNKSFLINVHRPEISHSSFDLIIAPEHEKIQASNVFPITGFLNGIKPEKLSKKNYAYTFDHLPTPQILVLGGDEAQTVLLSDTEVAHIADDLSQLQNKIGGTLIISQTLDPDHRLKAKVDTIQKTPAFFLDQDHPLIGAFAWADIIVCVGDEIANLSKACSTGKPVLHYKLNHATPYGFAEFYQKLLSMNMIATIHDNLSQATYHPLREAERVASHICQLLHKKNKVNVLL